VSYYINQTDALLAANQENAVARTGEVTALSATTATVLIAGSLIDAAYIRGTGLIVGDIVAVIKQDSSWLCIGALNGFGPNEVFNNSFERQGPLSATVPMGWNLANVTGTSTVSVVASGDAPEGQLVAQIEPAASARECVLNSAPIPVNPGESWSVSGYFAGLNPTSTPEVDGSLRVFFSTTDTAAYAPGSDTLVMSILNIPAAPPFLLASGQVDVPATMLFMRLGFRCVLPINGGMQLDFAIARKVG